jgi:hypothetical protein
VQDLDSNRILIPSTSQKADGGDFENGAVARWDLSLQQRRGDRAEAVTIHQGIELVDKGMPG